MIKIKNKQVSKNKQTTLARRANLLTGHANSTKASLETRYVGFEFGNPILTLLTKIPRSAFLEYTRLHMPNSNVNDLFSCSKL